MDYAKNLLKKYGWKEGDGLGKNNDGISKPIKANLKFDTSGLGMDKAAEFNNHWWERVFNDAANNIEINKNEKTVEIGVKNEDALEITTREYSIKKLKKNRSEGEYNFFVKKSILTGLREKSEKSEESDSDDDSEQLSKYKPLTDEEIFAACGGRTAHKGARHGINLTGKLSRIEEQERELIQKLQTDEHNLSTEGEWKVVTSKKKRKLDENKIHDKSDIQNILYMNEYCNKSKKKRKKEKKLDLELSSALSTFELDATNEEKVPSNETELNKKGKKKKRKKQEICEFSKVLENLSSQNIDGIEIETEEIPIKKKRKTSRNQNEEEDTVNSCDDFLKIDEHKQEKISKKKKKKKIEKGIKHMAVDLETSLSLTCTV